MSHTEKKSKRETRDPQNAHRTQARRECFNGAPRAHQAPPSTPRLPARLAWLTLLLSLLSPLSPRAAAAPLAGSLEGDITLTGTRSRTPDEGGALRVTPLSPSWSARPAIDYQLTELISVGGELSIGWLRVAEGAEASAPARLTFSPSARLRMDFPLSCSWVLEGVLAAGISAWGAAEGVAREEGGARQLGFGFRLQLGARYMINTQVHALLAVSYLEQSVYSDQESMTLRAAPVTIGLRSSF